LQPRGWRFDPGRLHEAAARASEAAARSEAEFSNQRLYDVKMNLVQRAWEEWFPPGFIDTLDEQRPEKQNGVERRGFEWFYWQRKLASGSRTLKRTPPKVTPAADPEALLGRSFLSGVLSVAFGPDGSRLAFAGFDGTVRVRGQRSEFESGIRLSQHEDVRTNWCQL
jgi:hypothetical protein